MAEKVKIGDIYWFTTKGVIAHPHVIIRIDENNEFLSVCSITTNTKKFDMPGNVILNVGEGNLEAQSIVEVSKEISVSKNQLKLYIGSLSIEKVNEILDGIHLVKRSFLTKHS